MKQKRKKNCPRTQNVRPFPVKKIPTSDSERRAVGIFNGLSVVVSSIPDIIWLCDNGNYGTGSMSRSTPKVLLNKTELSEKDSTETLILFWEEAFFLHHCLRILIIQDVDKIEMDTQKIWSTFVSLKPVR